MKFEKYQKILKKVAKNAWVINQLLEKNPVLGEVMYDLYPDEVEEVLLPYARRENRKVIPTPRQARIHYLGLQYIGDIKPTRRRKYRSKK